MASFDHRSIDPLSSDEAPQDKAQETDNPLQVMDSSRAFIPPCSRTSNSNNRILSTSLLLLVQTSDRTHSQTGTLETIFIVNLEPFLSMPSRKKSIEDYRFSLNNASFTRTALAETPGTRKSLKIG